MPPGAEARRDVISRLSVAYVSRGGDRSFRKQPRNKHCSSRVRVVSQVETKSMMSLKQQAPEEAPPEPVHQRAPTKAKALAGASCRIGSRSRSVRMLVLYVT